MTWKRAVAAIPVLVLLVWACSYHTYEFKGGIAMNDGGFFSYPRYHARLGRVDVIHQKRAIFDFGGLPSEDFDLYLKVENPPFDGYGEIRQLPVMISVTLTDESGKEICAATGPIANGSLVNQSNWILSTGGRDSYFWNEHCLQFPVHRFRKYRLIVDTDDRAGIGSLIIIPTLGGGGVELP